MPPSRTSCVTRNSSSRSSVITLRNDVYVLPLPVAMTTAALVIVLGVGVVVGVSVMAPSVLLCASSLQYLSTSLTAFSWWGRGGLGSWMTWRNASALCSSPWTHLASHDFISDSTLSTRLTTVLSSSNDRLP